MDETGPPPEGEVVHSKNREKNNHCCSCCFHEERLPSKPRQIPMKENAFTQKVLVLDLDETLVHCHFGPPEKYDLVIPISIEAVQYDVYVQKRPFVDEFLAEVSKLFYIVIFTASVSSYANPIIDVLLPNLPAPQRLFRESCTSFQGMLLKDLTMFNTSLRKIVIVDNNPCAFSMHPQNAILSINWEGQYEDRELIDRILPLLKKCADADDVRDVLAEAEPPHPMQNTEHVLTLEEKIEDAHLPPPDI